MSVNELKVIDYEINIQDEVPDQGLINSRDASPGFYNSLPSHS